MQEPQNVYAVFEWLNSIGTAGLVFIVWALMTGRLITRREYDGLLNRCERLEQKYDKAVDYGHRAVDAGKQLISKLNE